MMVKISTEPSNSSGSAKSSREKRAETSREVKRKAGRECGIEYSSGILSVQKPQPRFHVRVQTGRGEQPLDVWRIGVVHRVYNRIVTGSMIPDENKLFFHTCRFALETQVQFPAEKL